MKTFFYHWPGMARPAQIDAYTATEARRLIRQVHCMFRLPAGFRLWPED
jgi:hypothetical protein